MVQTETNVIHFRKNPIEEFTLIISFLFVQKSTELIDFRMVIIKQAYNMPYLDVLVILVLCVIMDETVTQNDLHFHVIQGHWPVSLSIIYPGGEWAFDF